MITGGKLAGDWVEAAETERKQIGIFSVARRHYPRVESEHAHSARVFCHCSCGLGARVREAEGSRGAAKSLEAARRQAKRDYTAVTTAYPVSDRSLPTLACALVTRERRARALGTLACITFCVRSACVRVLRCAWRGSARGKEQTRTEAARITPNRGNMSIAALLQAAEYIERRERGECSFCLLCSLFPN